MIGKLLTIFFLINISLFGQAIIKSDDFKDADGIVIIEFWEDWNKTNECKWLKELDGVSAYRMKMSTTLSKKIDVKVLPTLVLFDEQEIVDKWEADITFQLPKGTRKKVQEKIDDLNISKF